MPRLFSAIKIPDNIADILALKQSGLKNARWIAKEDLHITICFIGDIDNRLAEQIYINFEKIDFHAPINIEMEKLDIFGDKKPRSLIVKIKENDILSNLKKAQSRQLELLGVKIETRKYIPHITLARFGKNYYQGKNKLNPKQAKMEIAQYLSHNNLLQPIKFTVDNYYIFSAKESVGGGPYIAQKCYWGSK